MTKLKLLTLVAVTAGSLAVSSHAFSQTVAPDALQAARDLVALTSGQMTTDMVANLTGEVWPKAVAALREQYPSIDAAATEELRREFERIVVATVNDVMKEAPAIYAHYFTAQEMRDTIAFYKTPAGAKALRLMPQITAEIAAAIEPRTQGLQEKINLAFLTILQKRGLYAQ